MRLDKDNVSRITDDPREIRRLEEMGFKEVPAPEDAPEDAPEETTDKAPEDAPEDVTPILSGAPAKPSTRRRSKPTGGEA